MAALLHVFLPLLLLVACASTPTSRKLEEMYPEYEAADLKNRAGFDLQCPAAQVTIVPLDMLSYGVRGCGRQIRYQRSCKRCKWGPAGPVADIVAK